jgi:tetratricopeptide (TPR) repeat protein
MLRAALIAACGAAAVAGYEMQFSFDSLESEGALPSAIMKSANEAYRENIQGLDALEAGEYDRALEHFEQAAELLPGYTDAVNNQGVVYFRRGAVGQAREHWRRAVAMDGQYAIAHYNLGVLAFHEGDYDAARKRLDRALSLNQRFVDAAVMLGRVHLADNDPDAALRRLKRAWEIDPDHRGAWGYYAFALLEHTDTAAAVAVLEQHPDNPDALDMLGTIDAARGDYDRAAERLSRAVARGADAAILVKLATAQLESGACAQALASLDSYVERAATPGADAYLLAGVAAKECGDSRRAERYFARGVEAWPRDPLLRYNLGQMYFVNKDYAAANRIWRQVSDTLRDPGLYHLRALSAFHTGDLDRAAELVEEAIALDAKPPYYDLLGVIRYRRGRGKEAAAAFKKALAIDPAYRSAQLNLALLGQSPEMLDQTIEQARRAVDTCDATCPEVRLQLSILYYHRGRIDQAIEVLRGAPAEAMAEKHYRHLALYYRANQDWAAAIAVLERACSTLVVDVKTEYELAETYMRAGRFGRAVKTLRAALDRWTDNPWRIYYQLGYASMEMNRLDEARRYFELSLKSKGDNVAARGLLAFVHSRRGDTDEARRLWERNLQEDPDNPTLWINMGLAHEQQGRYDKALESYHRARLLNDDDALHVNIGNVYAARGETREARQAYARALDSKKRDIAAYNSFILARRERDRARANKMYRILESEFAESIHARRAAAELALWEGDTAAALRGLESLSAKNEYDWQSLALIYIARGRFADARRAIERIPDEAQWKRARTRCEARLAFAREKYERAYALWKETGDTSFSSRYNTALAAYQAGRRQEALTIGKQIVRRAAGADRADLVRLLGNASFGLGRWKQARTWYRQLSAMQRRDPLVKYNLAVAAYNLDDMEEAWELYQEARKLDPSLRNEDIEKRWRALSAATDGGGVVFDSADVWYNRAVEFQREGDDSAAAVMYRRVLAVDSSYLRAWNNLGAIYAARGDLSDAEMCYRKAIERRHDLDEAYANLVTIYIAMGDLKNAKIWAFKGRAHNPDSELLERVAARVAEEIAAARENEAAGPDDAR